MEAKFNDISTHKLLDIKLSNKEVIDNTKQILFTIYNMMKQGDPTYAIYLFEDVFTEICSIHDNQNYIIFQIKTTDEFSYNLIRLLLSYKHKYLEVFNLTHIDNNELILPNENKGKFYDLVRVIS